MMILDRNFKLNSEKNVELNSVSNVNVEMDIKPIGRKMEFLPFDIKQKVKKMFATAAICAVTGSVANAQAVKVLPNGNVGINYTNPTGLWAMNSYGLST